MPLKRNTVSGAVTPPLADEKSPGSAVAENAYPRVLGGRPLKQLDLPREFLAMPRIKRPAGTLVAPSNLADVRAKLMAKKPKLG